MLEGRHGIQAVTGQCPGRSAARSRACSPVSEAWTRLPPLNLPNIATSGVFSCGCGTLSCAKWGLVPWSGIKFMPLHCEHRVLATGLPRKSLYLIFSYSKKIKSHLRLKKEHYLDHWKCNRRERGRVQLLKEWHRPRTQHKPIRIKWDQDGRED